MSLLSKLIKKVKKPLLGAAKTALGVATGGLSDKAIALANTGKKLLKGRKVAKQLDAMPRLRIADVRYSVPGPREGVSVSAEAMPGGSSLRKKSPKRRKSAAAKKRATQAKNGREFLKRAKRAAPKGGLDLKKLSASWKAAGKPGTWQGWIKANK
ncbi:MAG: hypothetical protein ACOYB0_10775 [Polynucleobacter sp.]